MEVYVLKALQKLRSESGRKDVEFREAADAAIGAAPAHARSRARARRARAVH